MTAVTTLPFDTEELVPEDYPEFVGPATDWQASETHLQARPVGGDTWVDVIALSELQGEPGVGTPGADGNTILSGAVDPSTEGEDGDWYINTTTWEIFGPKATTWPAGVSLKGADGSSGVSADADNLLSLGSDDLPYLGEDDLPEAGGAGTKTIARFTWVQSQPPATAFATLDTRNSIAALDFDDTVTESTTFVDIIPEGMDLSSGILCRIHWGATTATSGDVRWGVQFENMNTDMDADSYDTAALATSTTDATSGKKTITEITCTTIDSLAAGDLFRLRVYRNSADTATDTMVGDAELVGVELRGVA